METIHDIIEHLEKIIIQSQHITFFNYKMLQPKIEEQMLKFLHEIFVDYIIPISESSFLRKKLLKILINLKYFVLQKNTREKIAIELLILLNNFHRLDLHFIFNEVSEIFKYPQKCSTNLEMKFQQMEINSINKNLSSNISSEIFANIFKFYLKICFLFFFGNEDQSYETFMTNSYINYNPIFKSLFVKLFGVENSFLKNIFIKQLFNMLNARKIYASKNISTNAFCLVFINLLICQKGENETNFENLKPIEILVEIRNSFLENEKFKANLVQKDSTKNFLKFFQILKTRSASYKIFNSLNSFYNPDRILKKYTMDNFISENVLFKKKKLQEFYINLTKILSSEQNLTIIKENFDLTENENNNKFDFDLFRFEEENFFGNGKNPENLSLLKFLNIKSILNLINSLVRSNNYDKFKYSIHFLLFPVYKKIYKSFKSHFEIEKDSQMEISEDKNIFDLVKTKNLLIQANSKIISELNFLLKIDDLQFGELNKIINYLIKFFHPDQFNLINYLFPNHFNSTDSITLFENLPYEKFTETFTISFLNFLIKLIDNRKHLNKNFSNDLKTIISKIFDYLKFLPESQGTIFQSGNPPQNENFLFSSLNQNFVLYFYFLLKFVNRESSKILHFIQNFEIFRENSQIIQNLRNPMEYSIINSNPLLIQYEENFKIFLANLTLTFTFDKNFEENENLNQIKLTNTNLIFVNILGIFLNNISKIDESNYKTYTNAINLGLNYFKSIFKSQFNPSSFTEVNCYFDFYCRNPKCQKSIKPNKILIHNKFLYSCNSCEFFHLTMNFNKYFLIDFENVFLSSLKQKIFEILFFEWFAINYDKDRIHIHLRVFNLYLNFIYENFTLLKFDENELQFISNNLNEWKEKLQIIDFNFQINYKIGLQNMKKIVKQKVQILNYIQKLERLY